MLLITQPICAEIVQSGALFPKALIANYSQVWLLITNLCFLEPEIVPTNIRKQLRKVVWLELVGTTLDLWFEA